MREEFKSFFMHLFVKIIVILGAESKEREEFNCSGKVPSGAEMKHSGADLELKRIRRAI